jgi:cytochrome c-type biogenesis protein CcmF
VDAGVVGLLALWGCLAVSGVGVLARWLLPGRLKPTSRLLGVATLLALISTASLVFALLLGDFSLDYVARTTSLVTPWPFRIAALWGAMEGSLLFYATLTLGLGWIAVRRLDASLGVAAAQVVSLVGFGLTLLTISMASPFQTLDVPAVDGQGLLAILQHPAMVYHPPILYLGLTSLVAPFAVTVAAILGGQTDRHWIELVRRQLLFAWTLLTLGMVAGANWAYVELGWGGFWAWDPVENTSLMPWLAATVFLHTSRVQNRDGRLARWNAGFALLPFVLTLVGIYLTRSGSTGSIHAFAESAVIGRALLTTATVGLLVSGWLTMRVRRGKEWEQVSPLGRDTWLAGNGGLLTIALVFVTVGSAYPAYLVVFAGQRALVRPGFFVVALLPVAYVLIVALAFAFKTKWAPARLPGARVTIYLLISTAVGLSAVGWLDGTPIVAVVLLGMAAATVVVVGVDVFRSKPSGRILAGHLAHVGIALVLAVGAASSLGEDLTAVMGSGDTAALDRYAIELGEIRTGEESRFIYLETDVTFARDGETVFTLSPEIRAYEDQALPVPEPALRSTPLEDVVVAISRVAGDASAVEVSVFVRPLVFWVWAGSALIVLAGLVALFSTGATAAARRRRATGERQPTGATTSG